MTLLAILLLCAGCFTFGRAYEAHRLRYDWDRIEREWDDLNAARRRECTR